MASFTPTSTLKGDMQVTTSISIPVALLYSIPFLTGELYASPRALWLAVAFGSVCAGPLACGYEISEMLP